MKIGITGSRTATFLNPEVLVELNRIKKESEMIIHGGAIGADTLISNWATKNMVNQRTIQPINKDNKINYLYRNVEIIEASDKILAYWDGKSRGTKFTIDYAKARGKEVKIIKT